jgi:hypothetical protein
VFAAGVLLSTQPDNSPVIGLTIMDALQLPCHNSCSDWFAVAGAICHQIAAVNLTITSRAATVLQTAVHADADAAASTAAVSAASLLLP